MRAVVEQKSSSSDKRSRDLCKGSNCKEGWLLVVYFMDNSRNALENNSWFVKEQYVRAVVEQNISGTGRWSLKIFKVT